MSLVSLTIPNLITGVSQQPPALRLSSSFAALINCWPSVVTGLNKRPPTEHIANLGINLNSAVGHIIDKGPGYQYVVVVSNGLLKVFDFNGVEQTVSFPNGNSYLVAADVAEGFRFLTFGDTTFILNRDMVVEKQVFGEEGTASYSPNGTVATFSALPSPGTVTLNHVYLVTSTNKYYKRVTSSSTSDTFAWEYVDRTESPSGTVVSSLPTATSEGVTLSREIWSYASGDLVILYDNYTSVQTGSSTSSEPIWQEVLLSDLVDVANGRLNPASRATVHVTQSISNSYYNIYINNTLKGTFLTNNGVDAANAVQSTTTIAESLGTNLNSNGVTNTVVGSTIAISGLSSTDTLKVTSSNGDKCLKGYRDEVASFSDLPPNEIQGRIVKVKGSPEDNRDDYYVMYDKTVWVETVGYNEGERLVASTMPHVLIRNTDGTWTFKEHTWQGRTVGDKNSNPVPSFVGDRLTDMYLYANRLGFLSSTNIILSEADMFENMFRTTVATLVDSDPLDFSVLSSVEEKLQHAVPFNKDLLVFGSRTQYRFTYNQFIGPKNVQAQFTTSFSTAYGPKPVNMGASVYFIDDKNGYRYAKLYEYYPKENVSGDDAEDVTSPVPQYVSSGVMFVAASPRVQTSLIGTSTEPDKLYLYKFYWAGDKKIQNAWSEWQFPAANQVLWGDFSENQFFMLVKRGSSVFLEKVQINEEIYDVDLGSRILLDRLVNQDKLTGITYSGGNTTFLIPYTSAVPVTVVSRATPSDPWVEQVSTMPASNEVSVVGDISDHEIMVGIGYDMVAEFSTPYVRFQKGQGEVVALDARLQIRHIWIEFSDTERFKTSLALPGRAEVVKTYSYGSPVSHRVRIPLMGKNTDVTFKLINDSPFSSQFSSAEWCGVYQPKTKRM